MAKRLCEFPGGGGPASRRYPWAEWADGSVWQIERGVDFDTTTENMRVNLHMKADGLTKKVRTSKVTTDSGREGLVFQFSDPEESEVRELREAASPDEYRR